jgi:hypothetical protein
MELARSGGIDAGIMFRIVAANGFGSPKADARYAGLRIESGAEVGSDCPSNASTHDLSLLHECDSDSVGTR